VIDCPFAAGGFQLMMTLLLTSVVVGLAGALGAVAATMLNKDDLSLNPTEFLASTKNTYV